MKSSRKLVPAIVMLLVSAIVMATASYAWFTMSREVSATGMEVTVSAPNNLLIKGLANTNVSTTTDTDYTAIGTVAPAEGLKSVLPASSINGLSFFTVDDNTVINAGTGARETGATLKAANTASTTSVDGYYVDFKYSLKAEGKSDVAVYVKSADIARTSGGTDNGLKAVRFAVLNAGGTAANTGITNAVYNKNGTYFTTDNAVASLGEDSTATLGTVLLSSIGGAKASERNAIVTVPAGSTTDITVRVWVEGEDTNCKVSEAASLDFTLDLKLADVTYDVTAE